MTSLCSFGISPSIIAKLNEAEFFLDADVCHLSPSELSNATQLSLKESCEVIRLASSKHPNLLSQAMNLKDLVEQDESVDHIVTFCEAIDNLLVGGIPLQAITEISGTPGIGKTQLCLQTCISVQLPEDVGGVEGEAVFIDTEGSFDVFRLKEMAEWAVRHTRQSHSAESMSSFSVEHILSGIHYFRCQNHLELLAVVKNLPSFLEGHKKVRLVAIDSIAFHFRHDFTNMMSRTSLLCAISQDLIQLSSSNNLAVVVTNQMTTKVEGYERGQVVAALGETWGHCPTIRLLLHWEGNARVAKVVKAPHIPRSSAYFQITSGGIRDRKQTVQGKKRKLSED